MNALKTTMRNVSVSHSGDRIVARYSRSFF